MIQSAVRLSSVKRWALPMSLALVASVASAQRPFTIYRPLNGSKVRETVRFLVPKGSVPPGGYVGLFLGGRFVEASTLEQATDPRFRERYLQYSLDTKARGIEDGTLQAELVLYVDYNGRPRIVNRSSVNVTVQNRPAIRVPTNGLLLRYAFREGSETVYRREVSIKSGEIDKTILNRGGILGEQEASRVVNRQLVAVDARDPNGTAMLRFQMLPQRGKDYDFFRLSSSQNLELRTKDTLAPVYVKVTPQGRELFASIPPFVEFDANFAKGQENIYPGTFPLPTLPERPVRPGDTFPAVFKDGDVDLGNTFEQTKVFKTQSARGEFVGLEWEGGHPCAKLRYSLSVVERVPVAQPGFPGAGGGPGGFPGGGPGGFPGRGGFPGGPGGFGGGAPGGIPGAGGFGGGTPPPPVENKREIIETVWFALDLKKPIKIVNETSFEGEAAFTPFSESGGGGGGAGLGGGFPGGGARVPGGPSGFGGGGAAPAGGKDNLNGPGARSLFQAVPPLRGGNRGGQGGFPGGPGGFPGAGGFPGFGGAPQQVRTVTKLTITVTFTIEK